MRIKIGSEWFQCAPGQPIMVDLKPQDKANIAYMIDTASRYALFHDADGMSVEQKLAWMDEGASE